MKPKKNWLLFITLFQLHFQLHWLTSYINWASPLETALIGLIVTAPLMKDAKSETGPVWRVMSSLEKDWDQCNDEHTLTLYSDAKSLNKFRARRCLGLLNFYFGFSFPYFFVSKYIFCVDWQLGHILCS